MNEIIVNVIAVAVILLIVGGAVFYLVRAKKRGQKCIGCPYSKQCGGSCSCNSKGKEEDNQTENKK